ncbi:hypothetical protein CCGE531_32515 (plasmid) [Rhizobium sp. CCGE531]|nr:hypothetical protein CCGE531_32515 [Rhizobium sp. CCGE531]TGE91318.1 hypothetical protein C9417_28785 [Rhizobium sp. SEMIA 4088]
MREWTWPWSFPFEVVRSGSGPMPACPSVRSPRTGGKTGASRSGPSWTSGAGLRAKRATCPR